MESPSSESYPKGVFVEDGFLLLNQWLTASQINIIRKRKIQTSTWYVERYIDMQGHGTDGFT
jgi:hypothetical protein